MWLAFGPALVGALLLTPLARWAALRVGIVDRPDGQRKLHKHPVPLLGGIAVYLALLVGLLVLRSTGFGGPALAELSNVLMAAAGFVCLLGCIDDTWDLNARFKLLLQICSVLPVVLGGYTIDRILAFGYPIELGWLGVPLTVLWLVGCINALNLLDGMDGLAAVVGLSTSAMLAIIASNMGHDHVAVIAIALAGALAGFLVYNLPPASIFLGDSGSMVIGLVVGLLSMQGAIKTQATLSITAPAVLLSIPMFDTLLAIVRRKLTGQRFYAADRGHIHHRLLERGLNTWQALGIISLLCLMTGGAAIAAMFLRSEGLAWIIALSIVVLLVRLRVFGHYELSLVKLSLTAAFERFLHGFLVLIRRSAPDLPASGAVSFDDAWQSLIREARQWTSRRLEVELGQGEQTHSRHEWQSSEIALDPSCHWTFALTVRQPSGAFCQMSVTGTQHGSVDLWYLSRVARVLKAFGQKWSQQAEHAECGDAQILTLADYDTRSAPQEFREAG